MMETYPGEFEIYLFPDIVRALTAVEKFRVKVILIERDEQGWPIPKELLSTLPDTAVYYRLADTMQEETDWLRAEEPAGRLPVLCRYRSAEEWHRQILKGIAETEEPEKKARIDPPLGQGSKPGSLQDARICLFASAGGGCGASTAALSFANCCARHHRNVLFLDLEAFPTIGEQVGGQNLFTMEDVLLSLRGRKYAPDAVLAQALSKDENGVSYLLPPGDASILFDMTGEEIVTLIDLLRESRKFSAIVIDLPLDASLRFVLPFLAADLAVLVSDGGQIANRKTMQMMALLPSLCAEDALSVQEKTCLLYNRFRTGASEVIRSELFLKLGGIGELQIGDHRDLIDEIACSRPMERLYETLFQQGVGYAK